MELATAASDYLVAAAERLGLGNRPEPIRAMLIRACGGKMSSLADDGSRASLLTSTGTPFEASVTGGHGLLTPALRYVTEAGTVHSDFESRLTAQLAALQDLSGAMPNGAAAVADTLRSFVAALYPDPAAVRARRRFATWLGLVHHVAVPDHAAGIKLYGSLRAVPGALSRLCVRWPEFAGLVPVPEGDEFVEPYFAAIEIDANGVLNHKVYLRARHDDIATPMKLVRHFGDPAWEMLSELVRCGVDAALLHRHRILICRGRRDGTPSFALQISPLRGDDLTALGRELASRHHGTTAGMDALTGAAESTGATWRYSVVGLSFSPDQGIDKLNVYVTPTWNAVH